MKSIRRSTLLAAGTLILLTCPVFGRPTRAQSYGEPSWLGHPHQPTPAERAGLDAETKARHEAENIAGAKKLVSLEMENVPTQTALRTLFGKVGITNFVIGANVQGNVNLKVYALPFSLALPKMLRAATPPLTYYISQTDQYGSVYVVSVLREVPQPVPIAPTRK